MASNMLPNDSKPTREEELIEALYHAKQEIEFLRRKSRLDERYALESNIIAALAIITLVIHLLIKS